MEIKSSDVMELRTRTGVGMMDCKKALIETNGDMEKAIDYLREKGMATAAKKSGRIASEGIVYSTIVGKTGIMVEVNCESDFVAKGDMFKEFVAKVANYIANNNVSSIEDVVAGMQADTNEAIQKIGENISIRRYEKIVTSAKVDSYIHMGGKIGVLVEASENCTDEVIHDVALQIAAAKAQYVSRNEVPSDSIEKEKEIFRAQALNEPNPKPANIIEKMIEGRIQKFYREICLLDQEFVKNGDMTIAGYLKANGNGQIIKFVRYEMGEGLQKKADNFAQEIAEQMSKMKI